MSLKRWCLLVFEKFWTCFCEKHIFNIFTLTQAWKSSDFLYEIEIQHSHRKKITYWIYFGCANKPCRVKVSFKNNFILVLSVNFSFVKKAGILSCLLWSHTVCLDKKYQKNFRICLMFDIENLCNCIHIYVYFIA